MADEFHSTRWSVVRAAADGDEAVAGAAVAELCAQTWHPLYAFARRSGCGPEDAEDAVQGFMAVLLERGALRRIDDGRGRFRSFLLTGMANYLRDQHSRNTAQKRGGGAVPVSLDADLAEHGYERFAANTESPERAFDRVWAMQVMQAARSRLEEECTASGKVAVFHVLFPEESPGGGATGYAELSERLGISSAALRSMAVRLRRRWRDLIREELAHGVPNQVALEEEWDALRRALC